MAKYKFDTLLVKNIMLVSIESTFTQTIHIRTSMAAQLILQLFLPFPQAVRKMAAYATRNLYKIPSCIDLILACIYSYHDVCCFFAELVGMNFTNILLL